MDELSDCLYATLGSGEIRFVSISPRSGSDELLLCLNLMKLEDLIFPYEVLSYA